MKRRGFTLTELLVVVSIILVLMTLVGAAVSGARTSVKANATRQLIAKLNTILTTQLTTYDSRPVDMSACPTGTSKLAYRAWSIRRNMITGDMPDRWTDVQYMSANASQFTSTPQRAYIAIWNSLSTEQQKTVMASNASAECLFMIIMRGGIADCLDCGSLQLLEVGDEDKDGMPEFWDAWKNPIGFLLWAPALELPAGSGTRFFSGSRALVPFSGEDTNGNGLLDAGEDVNGNGRLDQAIPTLGMRPLIYSVGPDGKSGLDRHSSRTGSAPNESKTDICNLSFGSAPRAGWDCGNYAIATPIDGDSSTFSGCGGKDTKPIPSTDMADYRADNITNFDDEAKR